MSKSIKEGKMEPQRGDLREAAARLTGAAHDSHA